MSREPKKTTEALVQLMAECPRCGKKEARRIAAWRVEMYRDKDPDSVAESVTCACGCQYFIKVSAYQGAA